MYLMHKNDVVAKFNFVGTSVREDSIEIYNEELFPIGVKTENFGMWWKNNSIPVERDSIKRGLELLGVDSVDELKILSHGLSLTNNYWIKNENESIRWEDINFWDNPFSQEIGEALFNHKPLNTTLDKVGRSPESVNGGNLKKRWVSLDGVYYLQKKSSSITADEVFNEIFAYDLYKRAGVPIAEFKLWLQDGVPTCLSRCLTSQNVELIHFSQVHEMLKKIPYPPESEYEHFCKTLEFFGIDHGDILLFQQRLAIAYIIADTDMHYNNIALLYDNVEKKYSLCPAYDNGNSMYHGMSISMIDPDDDSIHTRPFSDSTYTSWNEQKKYIELYPTLRADELIDATANYVRLNLLYGEINPERLQIIANACLKRAYNLQQYLIEKDCQIPPECLIDEKNLLESKKMFEKLVSSTKRDLEAMMTWNS